MVRIAVATAFLLVVFWPAAGLVHHPPTLECKQTIRNCSRDIPRCSHLLDVVQQECRVWRKECHRDADQGCEELVDHCDGIWTELRGLCEPRIDECRESMKGCEEL